MKHEEAQANFSDFLEGELSPQEVAELQAHLEGCATCADELEELRQTLSSLSGLKRVPPPPGFLGKVQQRIRKRSRGRFFEPDKLLNRIPFEWISFIIILIMLVVYMYTIQTAVTDVSPAEKPGADATDARPIQTPPAPKGEPPKEEHPRSVQ